jgi:hypothetical protein
VSAFAARHQIATALGIVPEPPGCCCAACGPSPFPSAGPAHRVLGAGWSDWETMYDRGGRLLCTGCQAILGGRPGRVPPPLRMRNIAVIDGALSLPDWAALWALLTAPPPGLTVLSWATSAQKHHAMHARLSTPEHLVVGSDHGPIDVRPAWIADLAAAILTLRAGPDGKGRVSRAEILSGAYAPATIMRVGARAWQMAEAAIAPHRGSLLLDLLVACCPVTPLPDPTEDSAMALDAVDHDCLAVLAPLAQGSALRQSDPIAFWKSLFVRRVVRHTHRSLADFIARAMADLGVDGVGEPAAALATIAETWPPEREAATMRRLADRAPLLVALTYDARKTTTARKEPAR